MCGIVAYTGTRAVVPLLLAGLRRLEYRGYDSAGIGVLTDGQLRIVKQPGAIDCLAADPQLIQLTGCLGIAHTRWATHGKPNTLNAHPHVDCHHDLAVVHNGIIENYSTLRAILSDEGHHFRSETDTEVIAHLIEKFYCGDLTEAVVAALQNIEGTFGLAVIHRHENRIIVARRGSPLIIGLADDGLIVASDATAIIPYTKRVVYLNDDEMAVLTAGQYQLRHLNGASVSNRVHEIRWNAEQISKRGYPHFMLKEIHEQPEAVTNTLRGRLCGDQVKLSIPIDPSRVRRMLITACGTSWHAALLGKYLIEELARIPVEVDYASEFRYREALLEPTDIALVISQSGETADTLAALRKARAFGAQTIGIVNSVGSTIAREVDGGIYLHAGPEIGVASTKAFVCQVIALTLLALYLRQQQHQPPLPDLMTELNALPDKIRAALDTAAAIREMAERYHHCGNFLYLGRHVNFPVALEGALKLKEISYIHAEGYPAAEMKHGPIALIDEAMPVLFIANRCELLDKVISNMQEIRARQGRIITITDHANPVLAGLSENLITVPATLPLLSPLINVIPLQLLAYYMAVAKGLNVDKPRNLAKSVTVE